MTTNNHFQSVTFRKITSNLNYDEFHELGIFELFLPKSCKYIDLYFEFFLKVHHNLHYNESQKLAIFHLFIPKSQ